MPQGPCAAASLPRVYPTPASPLSELVLRRLAEMGAPGRPLSIREAVERSDGVLSFGFLRALARGEREILTVAEATALASALDVPAATVEQAATVLPDA